MSNEVSIRCTLAAKNSAFTLGPSPAPRARGFSAAFAVQVRRNLYSVVRDVQETGLTLRTARAEMYWNWNGKWSVGNVALRASISRCGCK